jgi:hypothetical protein
VRIKSFPRGTDDLQPTHLMPTQIHGVSEVFTVAESNARLLA